MSNEHKTQEALLQAIDIMIEQKLRNLGFNYYVDGVIKKDNGDGTYNILINGTVYNNISSQHKFVYAIGDTVQILIKNGDWNKKFIADTSSHKKYPTAKQYNSVDGTDTEFPLICHNGDNIWVGAYKRASRHHSGKGSYGKLFLSTGYNEDNKKGNETIYVSVPKENNTEADNYKVIHANNLIDYVYPVGSIYMSVNNVSPADFLGGTWEVWGSGRVPVGVKDGDANFGSIEQTGGTKTITLTTAQMPKHTHTISTTKDLTGSAWNMAVQKSNVGMSGDGIITAINHDDSGAPYPTSVEFTTTQCDGITIDANHTHTASETGGSSAHNNLQPYITCYMWKRTK